MNLENLLNHLTIKKITGELSDQPIQKITQDTREVEAGDIFICIEGSNFDGHQYAATAIEKGAIAVIARKTVETNGSVPIIYVNNTDKAMAILANAFYDFPSNHFQLVGVTGTNGKTTISFIIESIMKGLNKGTGLIGTVGIQINDDFYPTKNTTPDSITLQRVLKQMREEAVDLCAMEVSSQALVKGRVWGVNFDVAVMTNLTHEHMELHNTMAEYREAKKLLFSQLGNSYSQPFNRPKVAVLNKDDETFENYALATAAEVVSYSVKDKEADFFADRIRYDEDSTQFDLVVGDKTYPVKSVLVGEYNVANVLAAIAAVYALGYDLEAIITAYESFKGVVGRMELVSTAKEDVKVYVDYAHSPDAMEKVLETVKMISKGKIISVFGCPGKREADKRPIMAKIGVEQSDYAIMTTDETKQDDQSQIWEMMRSGIPEGMTNYSYIENRTEAIYKAVEMAESGDIVLLLGRGHDTIYYDEKGRIYHFSDQEAARNALERRKLI